MAIDTEPFQLLSTQRSHVRSQFFRRIVEYGIQAAEAIHYAHELGIIHRDIKPGNLLLDGRGKLWITDFGLARIEASQTDITMTGDLVGTLRYMSPEQVAGNRLHVDHRTDIYSLGATLYELLTLRPLWTGKNRVSILHQISDGEPVPPRVHEPQLPRDLETIILKAVAQLPADRYESAQAMRDDLERFLHHQPLKAKLPTRIDRMRKWLRRHPALLRSLALIGMILAGATWIGHAAVKREKDRAFTDRIIHERDASIRKAAEAVEQKRLRTRAYDVAIQLADRALSGGSFAEAVGILDELEPAKHDDDFRGFEWHYLKNVARSSADELGRHRGIARCIAVSPDGKHLATGGTDGTRIWDLTEQRQIEWLKKQLGEITDVAWDPKGRWLATTSSAISAYIWSTENWTMVKALRHDGEAIGASFTPDGEHLLTGQKHGEIYGFRLSSNLVRIWETKNWSHRILEKQHRDWFRGLAVSNDGRIAVSTSDDGPVCIWSLPQGELYRKLENPMPTSPWRPACIAFAHGHPWFALGDGSGFIHLWNIQGGTSVLQQEVHHGIRSVAFSEDDRWLAFAEHNLAHITSIGRHGRYVNSGYPLAFSDVVRDVAFANRDTVVLVDDSGRVSQWNFNKLPHLHRYPFDTAEGVSAAMAPNSSLLVIAAGKVRVMDLEKPDDFRELPIAADLVAVSPDGRIAATALVETDSVRIWNLPSWELKSEVKIQFKIEAKSRLHVSGDVLIIEHPNHRKSWYRIDLGALWSDITTDTDPTTGFFGRWQFRGRDNWRVQLLENGTVVWSLDRGHVTAASFSADGQWFATAFPDSTIHVRPTSAPDQVVYCLAESGRIHHVALSPNGKTLVVAIEPANEIVFWNATTGQQLFNAIPSFSFVQDLFFSPDGNALIVAGVGMTGQAEVLVLWGKSPIH